MTKNSESELESRSVISFVGRNTDGITISIDSDVNSRIHVYVQKTNQKVICTSRNRQNRRCEIISSRARTDFYLSHKDLIYFQATCATCNSENSTFGCYNHVVSCDTTTTWCLVDCILPSNQTQGM